MSSANPTPLRVGATGTLHGWSVRVVGRVVLAVDVEGETYFWNEYNVVDREGAGGTLVYEETDDGPAWKLFTPIEPTRPLTVSEAAMKREGDTVNLDGRPATITLVDDSRVYHVEGAAPGGVEVGDVAHYFNAEDGDRMLVVSWTGDEIEYYEGRPLRTEDVAAAFGIALPARATDLSFLSRGAGPNRSGFAPGLLVAGGVFVLVVGFSVYSCSNTRRTVSAPPPAPKVAASAPRLANGAQGMLQQQRFTITAQAMLELDRVGARHDRREHQLSGDTNERTLLINALTGAPHEWVLFAPIVAAESLADVPPYSAAALRKGASVTLDGRTWQVTELFLTRPLSVEGAERVPAWTEVHYGFLARDGNEWLLARWTEREIQFHRGKRVPERDVLAAFGPGSGLRSK